MMGRPIHLGTLGVLAAAALASALPVGCKRGASTSPAAVVAAAAVRPTEFNKDIEPILSENCYACHGPDPGSRKAGLRLDRAVFAFAAHERSRPAILPHDPDHSPLVLRVSSRDPKQTMPPPEAHKTLTPGQIAVLRRWIKEGAPYQDHWSFIPPLRPAVPAPKNLAWAKTPIDRFVLDRLDKEGLTPAPEADRWTLLRRVTYDLTGLPPTPEESEAFVHDSSPSAYEKVVDRLLASPRYGEHRAHYWLDAARYGDTHGLHLDDFRSVWPYRDYVIRAFNENKPYDQFAREQLAGDLLPARNIDQIVATAFARAGVSSGEGGTLPEELRVSNQRERAEAFGAVFLGLTTGCAVCHDHKFDPLTQRDFYRLTAFWNNLEEFPSDQNRADWPPYVRLPTAAHRAEYNAVLGRRSKIEQQIDARRSQARALVLAWLHSGSRRPRPVSPAGLTVRLRANEDGSAPLANSAPGPSPVNIVVSGAAPLWGEETLFWPTFRMDTTTRVEVPGAGDREKNQPFSVSTWLKPYRGTDMSQTPPFGAIVARNQSSRGWGLYFDHDKLSLHLVHQWPDNLILVESAGPALDRSRWNHVVATYDGSGRAAGVRLYVDGRLLKMKVIKDRLVGTVRTVAPLELGREYPNSNPQAQSSYQDFRYYERELSAEEAARLPREDLVAEITRRDPASWSEDEFKAVSDFYFERRDEPTRRLAAQLPGFDTELTRLATGGPTCLVCQESPQLAYANVLIRGVFNARGPRVQPGIPGFLPQPPAGAPPNRKTLADWVVSPGNPLTARVTVNRMWQELFGVGIVETPEDFGLMGARPSHPELLDWLAVDFRENGWNVKRFYKQVVLSATYQQSARVDPSLLERDPRNRLLARGPRFRMDAEMLRDSALAASGLLVNQVGGPSVKPYQPPGVWETGTQDYSNTFRYVAGQGDDLYRRSLYTFWKRMVPMPNMEAFDEPARDAACLRRGRSNTPLQALVTMNDPQWLEAARQLGERAIRHDATAAARLDYLGRLLLSRPLQPEEAAILAGALQRFTAIYAHSERDAAELITVGQTRPDPKIPATELAPWMLVASTALNLDATLNK
jgi:hypothetical protein